MMREGKQTCNSSLGSDSNRFLISSGRVKVWKAVFLDSSSGVTKFKERMFVRELKATFFPFLP